MGTSLIRNSLPLGPDIRTMPRALWWPYGVGGFLWEKETPHKVYLALVLALLEPFTY